MHNIFIDMLSYRKFIILNCITKDDIIRELNNYSDIYLETNSMTFKYLILDKNTSKKPHDTIIINCPDTISFFTYHNLILWFKKYNSLSIMLNDISPRDSYYCFPEPNNLFGDTLLGYFNDKRKFILNCPDSINNNGTISIQHEINNVLSVDELLTKHELSTLYSFNTYSYELLTVSL